MTFIVETVDLKFIIRLFFVKQAQCYLSRLELVENEVGNPAGITFSARLVKLRLFVTVSEIR